MRLSFTQHTGRPDLLTVLPKRYWILLYLPLSDREMISCYTCCDAELMVVTHTPSPNSLRRMVKRLQDTKKESSSSQRSCFVLPGIGKSWETVDYSLIMSCEQHIETWHFVNTTHGTFVSFTFMACKIFKASLSWQQRTILHRGSNQVSRNKPLGVTSFKEFSDSEVVASQAKNDYLLRIIKSALMW